MSKFNWPVLFALAVAVSLTLLTLLRRKKLTLADIGPSVGTFIAAGSIPAAIYLIRSIVLPTSHGAIAMVFPQQYALPIAAAGYLWLLISVIAIGKFYAAAIHQEQASPSQPKMRAPNDSARSSEQPESDQERRVV